jgi:hypothetical protein
MLGLLLFVLSWVKSNVPFSGLMSRWRIAFFGKGKGGSLSRRWGFLRYVAFEGKLRGAMAVSG